MTGKTFRRALGRWVDGVRRFATFVVVATLLLTLAAGWFVAQNIAVNTDDTDMLSAELPFRQRLAELREAFPDRSDAILVVLDGATPDLADDAALALADAFRRNPSVFGRVFDPAGEAYFRTNGLLFLETEKLEELSDRLAQAQPFLGALWHDPSLGGLLDLLRDALEEALRSEGSLPIEIGPFLAALTDVVEADVLGTPKWLSWQDLIAGSGSITTKKRRFIVLEPPLDYASLQPAATAIKAIRALAETMNVNEAHGVKVRLTGQAALAHEELQSVEEGLGLAGVLSLSLVIVLLIIGLRSVRLVAVTLMTLVAGLIWTAAFAVAAFEALNLISIAFCVLFIGLSVDFGIHFALRVKESVDKGMDHADALRDGAESVGGALTLCAVAAAIGFFSFLPTVYKGLAELGLIAGVGMFVALFANLTVLPALMTLMPLKKEDLVPSKPFQFRWTRRWARGVVLGAVVIAVVAGILSVDARFDFDPMNLKNPHTQSVQTLFDLMEDGSTTPYAATVLASSLDDARILAERLRRLPEVASAVSISDYVPKDQNEKLEIIGTAAMFLEPAFTTPMGDGRQGPSHTAAKLKDVVGLLEKSRGLEHAGRLAAALTAWTDAKGATQETLSGLEARLLRGLPGRLHALKQSLGANTVGLDDLPQSLSAREVAPDGRVRLRVTPSGDATDPAVLQAFVDAVRSVAPQATGAPVIIIEAGDAVVSAFFEAAALSICVIGLLLIVLLRSLRDVLFVFAPLILSALLTVAATVVFQMPFNFANVIVLPLLFGLGVAGGLHLVLRERDEPVTARAFATSTPRAVVFSGLTTIGSFGSIALSSHVGTSSMGTLLTVAVALTMACTLIVLPALMTLKPSRRGE